MRGGGKMQYEELHHRYGNHVAQRVRRELTSTEISSVKIDDLTLWLENRAEVAHEEYRRLLNNPLASSDHDAAKTGEACRRWREAEDLAYLVAIAEDVGTARAG
jgi:hypothetical protein